jgi:urease accessory protein
VDLIHRALDDWNRTLPALRIPVERLVLAKRRWRGIAEDGRDFGFDLEAPLADGNAVFQDGDAVYVLTQKYEPVLEVQSSAFAAGKAADAARLGWMIGNLHFQIEVVGDVVRVSDDPAVRQLFEREGIAYTTCKRVFHPLSGGHHH